MPSTHLTSDVQRLAAEPNPPADRIDPHGLPHSIRDIVLASLGRPCGVNHGWIRSTHTSPPMMESLPPCHTVGNEAGATDRTGKKTNRCCVVLLGSVRVSSRFEASIGES